MTGMETENSINLSNQFSFKKEDGTVVDLREELLKIDEWSCNFDEAFWTENLGIEIQVIGRVSNDSDDNCYNFKIEVNPFKLDRRNCIKIDIIESSAHTEFTSDVASTLGNLVDERMKEYINEYIEERTTSNEINNDGN